MIGAIAEAVDLLAVAVLLVGLWLSTLAAADGYARATGQWRARLTGAALIAFRLTLGRWMLTALEVLIVSDVLHSISHRTAEDLGILAAIVAIRVVLAYFLDMEISRIENREEERIERQEEAGVAAGRPPPGA